MEPKDPSAYTLAPPFWVTQADLYGPIVTYVPGRERNTRAHRDLTSKCWAMVFVCNLSKAVNIQVVEGHDAHHLADGLTRLCCEVGAPARLLIDRDSAFMKVLEEGHIDILDVESHMRKKTTMSFQLCPVDGHNFHGLVESTINSIQSAFKRMQLSNHRLHATGLQTVLKLVQNDLNSTPYGFTLGRTANNSPMLKLISPNSLLVGRINTRTSSGPFRLPTGPGNLMERVDKLYKAWFDVFNDTLLPLMITAHQPKWYLASDNLKGGDVVYFRKETGVLFGPWTVGMIDTAIRGRDL